MNGAARAVAAAIVWLRWPIVLTWLVATAAAIVYLPSLQEAGSETSLVGLVPKDAESIETGIRSAELFEVPVIAHTHVVQRNPEGLSEGALARVASRAKVIADGRDPCLLYTSPSPRDRS